MLPPEQQLMFEKVVMHTFPSTIVTNNKLQCSKNLVAEVQCDVFPIGKWCLYLPLLGYHFFGPISSMWAACD